LGAEAAEMHEAGPHRDRRDIGVWPPARQLAGGAPWNVKLEIRD
jgi:hypothetical protein